MRSEGTLKTIHEQFMAEKQSIKEELAKVEGTDTAQNKSCEVMRRIESESRCQEMIVFAGLPKTVTSLR